MPESFEPTMGYECTMHNKIAAISATIDSGYSRNEASNVKQIFPRFGQKKRLKTSFSKENSEHVA